MKALVSQGTLNAFSKVQKEGVAFKAVRQQVQREEVYAGIQAVPPPKTPTYILVTQVTHLSASIKMDAYLPIRQVGKLSLGLLSPKSEEHPVGERAKGPDSTCPTSPSLFALRVRP